MKNIFLLLIVFFGGMNVARSADFEAIPRIENKDAYYAHLSFTFLNVSSDSTLPNYCFQSKNPCMMALVMTVGGNPVLSVPLVDANSSCNTADCNTSTRTARTMGELAPLIRYLGRNGQSSPRELRQVGGWDIQLCLSFSNPNFAKFGCTPSIPKTLTCDILDTNAVVDFGSFSNDVTARQATGSIKVNCSSEAYLRVKFNSNVTNMPLSQDGRLTASLKFRDLIAGVGDNYVKVPGGNREIFIDGELRNNNTSHTGPFSVPVVAIIELM
ncbi:hypothetical protein NGC47_15375 [Serratia marcescens]|uniref:hypothetical protein n=1 Tax=Serratia TaxID=613 RepID=UPI0018D820C2|nr:hypothetical protein [Serratia marcescens]MBH2935276.1 hypothetical protein [Serratia marcescens]MBH3264203.1 hypothetical protein [Serratia marcescens]MBN5263772.1 hypothetical protein [Serratia marcescens]MBN5403640.1 hypothetical protein [Serratia marcescens]MEB7511759.1 hypothetical protein [Serratia marcescens]